jgi:hypothetical protein
MPDNVAFQTLNGEKNGVYTTHRYTMETVWNGAVSVLERLHIQIWDDELWPSLFTVYDPNEAVSCLIRRRFQRSKWPIWDGTIPLIICLIWQYTFQVLFQYVTIHSSDCIDRPQSSVSSAQLCSTYNHST